MNIKKCKLILLLLSSVYCYNNCKDNIKNSDCLENRSYEFSMCVIYSKFNKNNENVKKCINNINYEYNVNGKYNNIKLSCKNKVLDKNDPKVMETYIKITDLAICLIKSDNISYYNGKINCRKINNQIDYKKIYKCII